MSAPTYPSFRDPDFLRGQLRSEIAFFHPRAIDSAGGFFHYLNDDGSVYDGATRHLVNSTRMVYCYALAARLGGTEDYKLQVQRGLNFIERQHRQPNGGYAWVLRNGVAVDTTEHCYGLAFVLLAQAHALRVGIPGARAALDATYARMEQLFWSEQHGLYADEATPDGTVADYRGQNANMHSCEALIAVFEATRDSRFLRRAERIAVNITQRQAALAGGWIWEHYRADWSVDWDYNRHDHTNMFRPWGFQPGHMTEWAQLLLLLEQHSAHLVGDPSWLLPRARELFDAALAVSWDEAHGGIVYGIAPDMSVCDSDKYFWVQAESLATAALLGQRTGDAAYWNWYDKIWRYSWDHMIDHRHGAWYRVLRADNSHYGEAKPPHGKTDFYHPMSACLKSLAAVGAPLP